MNERMMALIAAAGMAGMTVDTLTTVPMMLKRVYGADYATLQADVLDQMQNMVDIDKAMARMFEPNLTSTEAKETRERIKVLGDQRIALIKKRGMTEQEGQVFSFVLMVCMAASPHKPTLNLQQLAMLKATGAIGEMLK